MKPSIFITIQFDSRIAICADFYRYLQNGQIDLGESIFGGDNCGEITCKAVIDVIFSRTSEAISVVKKRTVLALATQNYLAIVQGKQKTIEIASIFSVKGCILVNCIKWDSATVADPFSLI